MWIGGAAARSPAGGRRREPVHGLDGPQSHGSYLASAPHTAASIDSWKRGSSSSPVAATGLGHHQLASAANVDSLLMILLIHGSLCEHDGQCNKVAHTHVTMVTSGINLHTPTQDCSLHSFWQLHAIFFGICIKNVDQYIKGKGLEHSPTIASINHQSQYVVISAAMRDMEKQTIHTTTVCIYRATTHSIWKAARRNTKFWKRLSGLCKVLQAVMQNHRSVTLVPSTEEASAVGVQ